MIRVYIADLYPCNLSMIDSGTCVGDYLLLKSGIATLRSSAYWSPSSLLLASLPLWPSSVALGTGKVIYSTELVANIWAVELTPTTWTRLARELLKTVQRKRLLLHWLMYPIGPIFFYTLWSILQTFISMNIYYTFFSI